jgi:phage terminase large subunit-like protein
MLSAPWHRYAQQVTGGSLVACKWVRLACERHLRDLKRQSQREFDYRFDEAKAEKICRFIELLPHIKGPKAGKHIQLELWQKFIIGSVFGWVRKDNGLRRFRHAYIEVPRGNAKSTMSSGVGLYLLAVDGEGGAEVYSAATTRDQAKIVFNVAQQMTRKSEGFKRRFGVQVNAKNINQISSASKFEPLSSDANTLDGLNVHGGIIDELHAHKTRDVFDVIETGAGKREQSLIWCITTSGSNRAGICYEQRDTF